MPYSKTLTRAKPLSTRHLKKCVSTSGSAQRRPVPSALAQPRCSRSPDLDASGGFLWRGDPSSPTTFYPCGLEHPAPDSLCVCRRELEDLWEATPSIRRLA